MTITRTLALLALLALGPFGPSLTRADLQATHLFASAGFGVSNVEFSVPVVAGLSRGPFWIGGSAIGGGLWGSTREEYAALAGYERDENKRGLRCGVGVARLSGVKTAGFMYPVEESWKATGPTVQVAGWMSQSSWSRLGVLAHGSWTGHGSFVGLAITWGFDFKVLQ